MTRKRVIASGAVQGVYFRDSCRAMATTLGVSGWVRNLPDRTVEAVFEGEADAVDQIVDWAREGPPNARVKELQVYGEQPQGLRTFEVLPTPPSDGRP